MKRLLYILFILQILLYAGCNDQDYGYSDSETPKEQNDTINFLLLKNADSYSEIVPRLVFSYKDWIGMELANINEEQYTVFCFINLAEGGKSSLVVAGQKSATFMEYNPFLNIIGNELYTVYEKDNKMYSTLLNVEDWETQKYNIVSTSTIENQTQKTKGYHDTTSEEIKEIYYNFLNRVEDVVSIPGKYVPFSAQIVCGIWSKVAIPASKYMLYSDDPEKLEEIYNEAIISEGVDYFINLSLSEKLNYIYDICYNSFRGIRVKLYLDDDSEDNNFNDEYEKQITINSLHLISRMSSNMSQMQTEVSNLADKYDVSINIKNVTENSATVYASFRDLEGSMAFISKFGYRYGEVNGSEHEIIVSDFPNTSTISDLDSGKKYWVTAFIKSLGTEYVSPVAYFTTKMTAEVYPTSLQFTGEGGEKGVSITLPSDDFNWQISSLPEWCKITTKGPKSFFIKASANKSDNSRTGTVIITITSPSGEIIEKQVTVEQSVNLSWNNTKWNINGNLNSNVNFGNQSGNQSVALNFGLEIIDVKNNKFRASGDLSGIEKFSSIKTNDQNMLILEYKIRDEDINGTITFLFNRIEQGKIQGNLSGRLTVHSDGETINGTYHGTFTGTLQEN